MLLSRVEYKMKGLEEYFSNVSFGIMAGVRGLESGCLFYRIILRNFQAAKS